VGGAAHRRLVRQRQPPSRRVPLRDVTLGGAVAVVTHLRAIELGAGAEVAVGVRVDVPGDEVERHAVLVHVRQELVHVLPALWCERAGGRKRWSPDLEIGEGGSERRRRLFVESEEVRPRQRPRPETPVVRLVPDLHGREPGVETAPEPLRMVPDHVDRGRDPVAPFRDRARRIARSSCPTSSPLQAHRTPRQYECRNSEHGHTGRFCRGRHLFVLRADRVTGAPRVGRPQPRTWTRQPERRAQVDSSMRGPCTRHLSARYFTVNANHFVVTAFCASVLAIVACMR
jgi:hypothetical protein